MSCLADVQEALSCEITNALSKSGIYCASLGFNMPPDDVIQDVSKDSTAVLSLYLKTTQFRDLNLDFEFSEQENPCGTQVTTSDFSLATGQTIAITLTAATGFASPNEGDILSCQLKNGDFNGAVSVSAQAGNSYSDLATALAAAINATFTDMSAVASGAVVSLENSGANGYHVMCSTAGTWTQETCDGWAVRNFQLIVWTGDAETKAMVLQAITDLLKLLNKRYLTVTGEACRLVINSIRAGDADQQKDIYRDDFIFTLTHMVNLEQTLYGVTAGQPTLLVVPDLSQ